MRMLMFLVAGAVWWTAAASAAEVSEPNTPTTLQAYVEYALAHNAGLQSRFSEYKAALAMVPQAQALDDPKFTYGYFVREVETRVGPQKQRFGLMQSFPWFGKIEARTDAAAAAARAAGRRFEAARLETIAQTQAAYYEFAYLGRANAIAEANLELLRHFEQVVQARFRTAAGTHPDIIRAQIELAKFEDETVTLSRRKQPAVAMVNAVLNRAAGLDLPWPQQAAMPAGVVDESAVVDALADNNPDLAAMSFEIAAARSRVELAKKRYWPDVTLGVDWIQTDSALMPGTRDSGQDPIIAMVTVNLPLWRDSYSAGVEQAQSTALKTLQAKTQMQGDLASRAAELMFMVDDSRRKVTLYESVLIPKAKEMLRVSEEAYRTGAVDFLSLIDAQRKLLEFELTYERVLANHLVGRARLEALAGGFLPTKEE